MREGIEYPLEQQPAFQKGDTLFCECCGELFVYDGENWLYCPGCLDWMKAMLDENIEIVN